ncbi:MAG: hypothetical protein Q8R48_04315, partial [Candidatus Omnitrophota bacterium]|nr:hypothetical protein [Candidatus Omnitrophota bacterium]
GASGSSYNFNRAGHIDKEGNVRLTTTSLDVSRTIPQLRGTEGVVYEFTVTEGGRIPSGYMVMTTDGRMELYDSDGHIVDYTYMAGDDTVYRMVSDGARFGKIGRPEIAILAYRKALEKSPNNKVITDTLISIMRSPSAKPVEKFVVSMVLISQKTLRYPLNHPQAGEVMSDSDVEAVRIEAMGVIGANKDTLRTMRTMELQGRADMHYHTYRSDGSQTPSEVVVEGWLKGLPALSIVDHNTFKSHYEALKAGEFLSQGATDANDEAIQVIPAVEFDFQFPAQGDPDYVAQGKHSNNHIVVYYPNRGSADNYRAWIGDDPARLGDRNQDVWNMRADLNG